MTAAPLTPEPNLEKVEKPSGQGKTIMKTAPPILIDQAPPVEPSEGEHPGIPPTTYHFVDLPQTRLHYIRCGEGPPLIMMPATVSEIKNWLPLAQLMGRYFTVYFFELPGHGRSKPFSASYSSDLAAEMVESFIDQLGYAHVSVLGFSFGGILTMKVLQRLQERIRLVILISPAATHRALSFDERKLRLFRALASLLCEPAACRGLVCLLQWDRFRRTFSKTLHHFGCVERDIQLERRLKELQPLTFDVLARQMREVLCLELPLPGRRFSQPCYFAMSVNDPLLDFSTTLETIRAQFEHVHVKPLTVPYHQPPAAPTYLELVREYDPFIRQTIQAAETTQLSSSAHLERDRSNSQTERQNPSRQLLPARLKVQTS